MIKYKGYIGKVAIDFEAGILHGEVANTRDVITFQATSVNELKRAFEESVDDYLEFCKERGEEPEKPFSGQFVTRLDPALHRKLSLAARAAGVSLNSYVERQLEKAVAASSTDGPRRLAKTSKANKAAKPKEAKAASDPPRNRAESSPVRERSEKIK